jgi:hypothetical protein
MAQYTNYLARKVNGPVAQSLLKGAFTAFNEAEEWLNYRTHISIATATTSDLELIGLIIGAPRPYATVGGETVYADDPTYRRFLLNIAYLKRSKSIVALGEMLSQFVLNGLFEIHIQSNGDIRLVLDVVYEQYTPFLQTACDNIFTALPRIRPIELQDFHLYFRDGMFYPYYVLLDQPNVWTFTFDEENEEGLISATDPSLITYDASNQRLEMSVQY